MSKKFHNFQFRIKEKSEEESIIEYHKVKVLGKLIENEACLYSMNGGGEYSLYLQDRFFNFNIESKSKNVSSFEGDILLNKVKFLKLQLPDNIKYIILSLDTIDDLPKGCGGYIKFDASIIYYDRENKILQIGDINTDEITYRFSKNGYTQLKKNNIIGLMFTEIEL